MTLLKIIVSIAFIALIVLGFWQLNTHGVLYKSNIALAKNFPENSFSHQEFEQLLTQFVNSDGNINYQQWYDSKKAQRQLQQYLAAVAKYSPDNAPERFSSEQDKLAYWIYSYNAEVIHLILSHWPIRSVTDLKAPIEVIKGLGFFYNQRFIIGGETLNLYQLEHKKMLDANADARLHFVLNCGSASCPAMRPQLPVGINLTPFLEQASVAFINDSNNVRFNKKNHQLELSSIFKWYQNDFSRYALEHLYHGAKPLNKDQALLVFIDHFYHGDLIKKHSNAVITFIPYNWSLNNADQSKQATVAQHE